MKVSPDVERIVDKALDGERLDHDELVCLCDVDEYSVDSYYIRWGARQVVAEANDGVAEVHAQIGMDSNPCSKNCLFCSFAACNTARTEPMEMPVEQILRYAHAYVDEGCNCLTLMITADYDFEKYLDYMAQVRESIGPDMPICANMDDFDVDMARRLKGAGATCVYHAVRMGEGQITGIPIERRFETIQAAHEAGLKVLTCLEMIDPRWTNDQVVTNMERLAALKPESNHAFGMIAVPGTRLYSDDHYSFPKYHMYGKIMRLLRGREMRFGAGNLEWAEVGTNPRDDKNATEEGGLGDSLAKVRREFEYKGFETYEGPSPYWQ